MDNDDQIFTRKFRSLSNEQFLEVGKYNKCYKTLIEDYAL